MKILFLTPYPLGESPSQRFRFEQYFEVLRLNGHSWKHQSFLSSSAWKRLYSSKGAWRKVIDLIAGLIRRMWALFFIPSYDFIFIHRETSPIGPPLFEWMISKVLKKKIIYDFDDAIWNTDKVVEGRIEKILRWRSKVESISRWSYKVSCGNEYLCNYAKQFNDRSIVNPTTIDTVELHNPNLYKKENRDYITIGWTGSHSTLKYLEIIKPAIEILVQKYPQIKFLVIANKEPELNVKSLVFIPWSIDSEIEDLMKIDIGIMPLPNDRWANGKCGFKILQYMALNIPAIASSVGVNTKIIQPNTNGLLCDTSDQWLQALELLINDAELRKKMGENGRHFVSNHYSVLSNSENFLSLFS